MAAALAVALLVVPLAWAAGTAARPEPSVPSAPATPRAADVELGLPEIRAPLVLAAPQGGGVLTLAQVVDRLAEANGIRIVCEAPVRALLEETWCGLDAAVDVPPEEVYPLFESLLDVNGVLLAVVRSTEAPALELRVPGKDGSFARLAPQGGVFLTVPVAQMPLLHDHPALLVETSLELSHVDVRQLSTTLRGMLRDTSFQEVHAMGPRSLLVRGTGSEVASWIGSLREIDRRSAPDAPTSGLIPADVLPLARALPPVRAALTLPAPAELQGRTLAEVVERFAATNGIHVLMDATTRRVLREASCESDGALDVPPEEVYAFVEGLLARIDAWLIVPVPGAAILEVVALRAPPRRAYQEVRNFLLVSPDELPSLAGHPALLARTVLPLAGLEVRELYRSFRSVLRDTNTQQFLAAGDHQIALWGPGTDLVGWAALLQAAERGDVPLEEGVRRWLESVEARNR